LRGFLGLANFYRKYIKDFSKIASPMSELLKKGHSIMDWTQDQDHAFETLKTALTTAPCLVPFDPTKDTQVRVDACGTAIGAVLQQDHGKGLQPVAFDSRKLSPAEQRYHPRELELCALIHALKNWRHYLMGRRFQMITDHDSLKYLNTQPLLTGRLARWAELIQDYDMEIIYKPGKTNAVADALSRKPDQLAVMASTSAAASLPDQIKEAQTKPTRRSPRGCKWASRLQISTSTATAPYTRQALADPRSGCRTTKASTPKYSMNSMMPQLEHTSA
jgi:hypothetical protein